MNSLESVMTPKAEKQSVTMELYLNDIKARVMADAFKAVEQYFHEPSKTYIYFCKDLSHFGAKGIGNYPNESYENFQINLHKMVEPASRSQLEKWSEVLSAAVKKADLELKLKYLTEEESDKKQVKVQIEENYKCIFEELKKNSLAKKSFQSNFNEFVDIMWDKVGFYHNESSEIFEGLNIYTITYDKPSLSPERFSFTIKTDTLGKMKLMAGELGIKGSVLTRNIANQVIRYKG